VETLPVLSSTVHEARTFTPVYRKAQPGGPTQHSGLGLGLGPRGLLIVHVQGWVVRIETGGRGTRVIIEDRMCSERCCRETVDEAVVNPIFWRWRYWRRGDEMESRNSICCLPRDAKPTSGASIHVHITTDLDIYICMYVCMYISVYTCLRIYV
jgi:hypothetical protein